MSAIAAGDPAPTFTLPTDGGGTVSSAALRGRIVVVYFYPKDDTPGCTTEAIAFSAHAEAFAAIDAVVIGVSKDKVSSHDRFKAKHGLSVVLASDAETGVAEAFGTWGEKTLYGRTYMGLERATFLIDRDGIVRRVWRKVKVAGHADEVLAAARGLAAGSPAAA